MQVLQHGGHEFRARPLRIQILIAKYKHAPVFTRALCRDRECARMPQVEKTGWRGRKPSSVIGHPRILREIFVPLCPLSFVVISYQTLQAFA